MLTPVCVCLCMTSEDFISDKYLIYQLENSSQRERTVDVDENRQIENLAMSTVERLIACVCFLLRRRR